VTTKGRISNVLHVHTVCVESLAIVYEVYCHVHIDLYSTDIW